MTKATAIGVKARPDSSRAQPQPLLEVDPEQEEERDREVEAGRRDQADPEAARLEEAELDERGAAAGRDPPLGGDEQRSGQGRDGEAGERPGRPAQLAPLDGRDHHQAERERGECDAEQVEPAGGLGTGLRDQPVGRQQGDQPDGDVDQEDRAPTEAEEVERDQTATDDLPGDRREPLDQALEAEGLRPLGRRELDLDDGEDLRPHRGAAEALQQPGHDQSARARRRRAERGGDREAGDPELEHPAPAEDVAEAPAGDQRERVGEQVGRDDPLEVGIDLPRRSAAQRWRRHIDDEDVEEHHEHRGEQHRKQPGAARGGLGRGLRVGHL